MRCGGRVGHSCYIDKPLRTRTTGSINGTYLELQILADECFVFIDPCGLVTETSVGIPREQLSKITWK